MVRDRILLGVVGLLLVVFSILLVQNWNYKGRRFVLIGDILLACLIPASLMVPHDNLLMTFAVGGGLLLAGLVFRTLGKRLGENIHAKL